MPMSSLSVSLTEIKTQRLFQTADGRWRGLEGDEEWAGYSWTFRAPGGWGLGAGYSVKLQGATPVPPCPHPPMAPRSRELCPEVPASQGQRASAVGQPLPPPTLVWKGTEQRVLVSIIGLL